jgi:uncharacterized damage-inducible protein DinB
MSEAPRDLREIVDQSLTGRGAHALTHEVLDGLAWKLAGRRVEGFPHSIFAIVGHLVFWQRFCLTWIDEDVPAAPEHAADSWPGASEPRDEREWNDLVKEFRDGVSALRDRVDSLDLLEARGGKTVLEIVQLIASHNSYHVGQIAQLRRALGSWPPPSGGATW